MLAVSTLIIRMSNREVTKWQHNRMEPQPAHAHKSLQVEFK